MEEYKEYKEYTIMELQNKLNDAANLLHEKDALIAALEAELAELREAQRWIPVKEKLPEEGEMVIVNVKLKDICITTYQKNWQWCYEPPTHWRKVPATLKEG